MKDPKKVKQGKRNRRIGADTEKRTRADLESKGWIVSRWQNNVEFYQAKVSPELIEGKMMPVPPVSAKCIAAKQGRFRMTSTGFPDFIAYCKGTKNQELLSQPGINLENADVNYCVIFVECKSNSYMSKEEKEKARWYLKNNYCSKFLIAYREKEGRKVVIKYYDLEE